MRSTPLADFGLPAMHSAFIRKFVAFITDCGGERVAGSCCSSYARLYSFTASSRDCLIISSRDSIMVG
eukprot:COSAG02_NODE_547_length_20492_cov_265.508802_1_plen_68_part_00